MRKAISQHLYIFYSFVFLLHIINVFIENDALNYVIGILAIIMLAVSFPGATRLFKILGIIFLAVGGVMFATTDLTLTDIPDLMTSNISLLTLLAMLPWMNSVVRSGRFDRTLNNLLNVNVTDLGKLYPRSSVTTLTLASFLNLSAATISQDVLKTNLSHMPKKVKDSFISTVTLRGYTLALLWSPLEILLAISIFTTGVSYVKLLPWLLLIAFLAFVLDSIWGRIFFGKHEYKQENTVQVDKKNLVKKLAHLMTALILFLVLMITLGNLLNLDFIFTVTMLIFPFAVTWSFIMKRFKSFWAIGWNNWKQSTNTMQNFIVLFISLDFFANSMEGTPFLDFIQYPIIAFIDYPLVIFFSIQVIFISLGLIGVHPLATVGILSGIFVTLLELFNPISLALVLATSAIATLTVGSYGLIVQLTAMNTGQNPYRITMLNLPYAILLSSLGSIVAYLLL